MSKTVRREEPTSQLVRVPQANMVQRNADLGLWAPLLPITSPRIVSDSFGNIIKGVEVDGKSIPASTELEEAVDKAYQKRPSGDASPGPIGVWAMVTPASHSEKLLSAGQSKGLECDWLFLPDVVDQGMDIDKSVQLFDLVNQQDFDACEKTQPGMESRLYAEGGSLVPAEHHISEFHDWLIKTISRLTTFYCLVLEI